MNFVDIFVRRRVLAYMLSAAIILFGLIGLRDIGLDRMPIVERIGHRVQFLVASRASLPILFRLMVLAPDPMFAVALRALPFGDSVARHRSALVFVHFVSMGQLLQTGRGPWCIQRCSCSRLHVKAKAGG